MILQALRIREVFAGLAALQESVFPLDRAALAVSLDDHPDLDIEHYVRRLDILGARSRTLLAERPSPLEMLQAINEVLFLQERLRGNTEDYYNPQNSFLNVVLDLKVGIPISLSVIYIEVARRLGLGLLGVGFPGHFLVKCEAPEEVILIDPFNGGRIVTPADCQELLDRIYSGSVQMQEAFIRPMGKKNIVTRMLYNLKGIYYQKDQMMKALSVIEKILLLNPDTPSEIRDRGLIYMQTSLFSKALADLEHYLAHSAAPEEAVHIESHIRTLRRIVSSTN